jgi:hypothetical protein
MGLWTRRHWSGGGLTGGEEAIAQEADLAPAADHAEVGGGASQAGRDGLGIEEMAPRHDGDVGIRGEGKAVDGFAEGRCEEPGSRGEGLAFEKSGRSSRTVTSKPTRTAWAARAWPTWPPPMTRRVGLGTTGWIRISVRPASDGGPGAQPTPARSRQVWARLGRRWAGSVASSEASSQRVWVATVGVGGDGQGGVQQAAAALVERGGGTGVGGVQFRGQGFEEEPEASAADGVRLFSAGSLEVAFEEPGTVVVTDLRGDAERFGLGGTAADRSCHQAGCADQGPGAFVEGGRAVGAPDRGDHQAGLFGRGGGGEQADQVVGIGSADHAAGASVSRRGRERRRRPVA